jgi:hypothetical protein
MGMEEILRAIPTNIQVRHRGSFAPPRYDFFRPEVGGAIATKLAETYRLKSTAIVVNQNAASTHYFSFRYVLPGEPVRYFDVSIGIDQIEILFFNPATVAELRAEVARLWKGIFEAVQPIIVSSYCEANLHCKTEGSTKHFLSERVNIQLNAAGLQKGFSLSLEAPGEVARIGLEVSNSVSDGLYVVFVHINTGSVRDILSFEKTFDASLTMYRRLQSLADIELVEPT